MSHIELDVQANNLIFVLNQLRTGRDAKRYGHTMSADDTQKYNGAREIVKHLLVKDHENASDDELITGMENYIEIFMNTRHHASNHIQ